MLKAQEAAAVWTLAPPLLSTFPPAPDGTELTKVFSFVLVIIFLDDTCLKRKRKKNRNKVDKVENGDFSHSTVKYNIQA